MKGFAALFDALDQTAKTSRKVSLLADYFEQVSDADRLWCLALFLGRRPKRRATTSQLRAWAAEAAGLPLWLVEDTYGVVGDLAETIALILPPPTQISNISLSHWINKLDDLAKATDEEKKHVLFNAWDQLTPPERLVFNKLITGGFRLGIGQKLVTRALARATGKNEAELAHRLMGDWTAQNTTWHALIEARDPAAQAARPYPFYLSYALETEAQDLGDARDWRAEWKWDGIRGQLILRQGQHFLWSRGEELMTDRFPEFATLSKILPQGTVLDGEVLAWDAEAPLPFQALQKRITRKTVPKTLLREAPVVMAVYDLLESDGQDLRALPFDARRARLAKLAQAWPADGPLRLPAQLAFDDWPTLAKLRAGARAQRAEGVMLKHAQSPYLAGRKKGDWWKWKLDPFSIDAVMIYAQAGHGRRATLFTDYTFAVWSGPDLVPFTKAYSGLTDAEFKEITAWVRKNTLQRFGPVRQVQPFHVFEIAFEGIHQSPRHKSGVALRFPRMKRWRKDKTATQAGTLQELQDLLATYG